MTIKLHGAALSPFVRKTRVFLAEKGLEYQSVHVDPFNMPEQYSEINPLRRIPAMQYEDDCLADSAVICTYLERRHPNPALYPSAPADYAHALWIEKYADYEVAPNATFTVFRQRVLMGLVGKTCDENRVQDVLLNKLPPMMDYLESQIKGKDWFAGDQLSIADIAVASQFVNLAHGGEDIDALRWPALSAHVAKLIERPSFATQVEKENRFVQNIRKN